MAIAIFLPNRLDDCVRVDSLMHVHGCEAMPAVGNPETDPRGKNSDSRIETDPKQKRLARCKIAIGLIGMRLHISD